MMQFVD